MEIAAANQPNQFTKRGGNPHTDPSTERTNSMPGYSDAAKNLMLDELGSNAGFVSLHTGNPGSNGADEVSAAGPYERQAITWGSADEGEISASNQPQFDVPESTTISYFGLWSAVSGGTFYGGSELSAVESFGAQGQYTLTSVDMDLNG